MCVQSIRKDTASTELVSLYYFDRDSVCSDSQMDKKALEKEKMSSDEILVTVHTGP